MTWLFDQGGCVTNHLWLELSVTHSPLSCLLHALLLLNLISSNPAAQVETLCVVQLYACLDRIDHLEWADNSLYVLCGLYARAIVQASRKLRRRLTASSHLPAQLTSSLCSTHPHPTQVQVWAVDQPDWTCKIDEGPAGITRTLWAPDGLSLVCVASFQIRYVSNKVHCAFTCSDLPWGALFVSLNWAKLSVF